jgi:hypothetical protein
MNITYYKLAPADCAQFFRKNFQKASGSSADYPAYAGGFHLQPRPVFCSEENLKNQQATIL